MSHSRGSSSESERGGAARNGGEKKRKVYDGLRESGEEEEELTSVAQLISEIFQDDRVCLFFNTLMVICEVREVYDGVESGTKKLGSKLLNEALAKDKDWKLVYFVQSVIRDGPQRAWSDEEVKVVLEEYYGVTPRA